MAGTKENNKETSTTDIAHDYQLTSSVVWQMNYCVTYELNSFSFRPAILTVLKMSLIKINLDNVLLGIIIMHYNIGRNMLPVSVIRCSAGSNQID